MAGKRICGISIKQNRIQPSRIASITAVVTTTIVADDQAVNEPFPCDHSFAFSPVPPVMVAVSHKRRSIC
jgi:hypothetical protein